ncbi:hypothetical protein [Motiliproteus sp. MSK22-1]|uniref:hypothetical protein n=1 Tax=Motiliproteus sp. MSK22-1 TaxID=1897630 RepID=UPI00130190EB|nr:hypothetical protein [Motiliproteus sp. MSK22-1]
MESSEKPAVGTELTPVVVDQEYCILNASKSSNRESVFKIANTWLLREGYLYPLGY